MVIKCKVQVYTHHYLYPRKDDVTASVVVEKLIDKLVDVAQL